MDAITRRRALSLGGTALVALSTGCSGGGGDGGDETTTDQRYTVEITDGSGFDPGTLTVSTGAVVTWENTGSNLHSVTADEDELPAQADYFASGGFESEREAQRFGGAIQPGESFTNEFETAGTFEYYCIPHEDSETGTIEVEE